LLPTKGLVNVASVPHRSPFRYPGGKTWLVPYVRAWLASLDRRPVELAEPFAGGGIIGLSALFDEAVDRTTLVELDPDVGAVWSVIVGGQGPELADLITNFEVTRENVQAILERRPRSTLDRAFACIVRNRMQRGGIMAPGASLMNVGENGRGLASRWYPATLKRRLLELHELRHRLRFVAGDGVAFLQQIASRDDVVCFIDPPYTVAGRRLYSHSELDHEALFAATAQLRGPFLMTYDDAPAVRDLAQRFGLECTPLRMKNAHHALRTELAIGRNLPSVGTPTSTENAEERSA
jgi:DNA adenine methylase